MVKPKVISTTVLGVTPSDDAVLVQEVYSLGGETWERMTRWPRQRLPDDIIAGPPSADDLRGIADPWNIPEQAP